MRLYSASVESVMNARVNMRLLRYFGKNESEVSHLKIFLVSIPYYFPRRVGHLTCALLKTLCSSVLAI